MNGFKLYRQMGYIPEQNVFGAYWVSKYVDTQQTPIYTDMDTKVLVIYASIYRGKINFLSNTTVVKNNAIIYLSRMNVVDGIIDGRYVLWNSTELSSQLSPMAKIYSNGGCDILKNVASSQNR